MGALENDLNPNIPNATQDCRGTCMPSQFLEIIDMSRKSNDSIDIQYHHNNGRTINNNNPYDVDRMKIKWSEKINPLIPKNLKVKFFMRQYEEKLHNRYILTDIYGVAYGKGFAVEGDGFNEKDEILGLGMNIWKESFDDFYIDAPEPYMICENI